MNHLRKKAGVTKFLPIARAGASDVELKEAIASDEANYAPDEAEHIFLGVGEALNAAKTGELADPDKQVDTSSLTTASVLGPAAIPISKEVPGKKRYNIWRGQWHAKQTIRNPFDGKDMVVTWEFRAEGRAVVTNVPMEQNKVDEFNASRVLTVGNTYTEQMVLTGEEGIVLHKLDNPFEVKDIVTK